MDNKKSSNQPQIVNEIKPPGFGESLVGIFNITGNDFDFSKYSQARNKPRQFTDEKGVFKEMGDKKEPGKTVISE